MTETGAALVLALLIAWIGQVVWQGYRAESAPPLPSVDNGHGGKIPVCPRCSTILATTQDSSTGLIGYLGALIAIIGAAVTIWLGVPGLLVLGLGLIVYSLGKQRVSMLQCPACGHIAKRLN